MMAINCNRRKYCRFDGDMQCKVIRRLDGIYCLKHKIELGKARREVEEFLNERKFE